MKKQKPNPQHDQLYRLTERQGGYFTAAQAQQLNFTRPLITHHVRTGRFVHVAHGVYRWSQFPESPYADLFIALLQTGPLSVLSHDTALALYELSDIIPAQIHLTVPRSASQRHPGLKFHTNHITPSEITQRHGLAVTTVARTLSDSIATGLPKEQAQLAVEQAIARGLVSQAALGKYAKRRGGRLASLFQEIAQRIAKT